MGKVWEFYENLNEIVYVSDLDSCEIVYMNRKAREMHGFQSAEDYRLEKCYEIFQGSSCRCNVCTNSKLSVGHFVEWIHYNPVLRRTYSLKDTLIEENGRRLRMEIAFDLNSQDHRGESTQQYINNEAMINEGLRISLSSSAPDESIELLLQYLGHALNSERVYIFEGMKDDYVDNTYEWCRDGIEPQKKILQHIPSEVVKIWLERFRNNKNVVIRNLEDTKVSDPVMYEYLLPQGIHSLVVSPLIDKDEIIGFYGVDNPPGELLGNISTLFKILGHFIVSLLRRRNLVRRLQHLSYYDQLTGCRNRHAMDEFIAAMNPDNSIGVVYGDVMGLKTINDTQGHHEGDMLLINVCECMKRVFGEYALFRIGGDEFLILCEGITSEELEARVELLREDMEEHSVYMAIGNIWYPDSRENMDRLLAEADQLMYNDKHRHYNRKTENTAKQNANPEL